MNEELPFHRWPRSWGGWQAGSIIRCEGEKCPWCEARWRLVDPHTLEDMPDSPTIKRLVEEVRNGDATATAYNRVYNRHNRS